MNLIIINKLIFILLVIIYSNYTQIIHYLHNIQNQIKIILFNLKILKINVFVFYNLLLKTFINNYLEQVDKAINLKQYKLNKLKTIRTNNINLFN